MKWIKKIVKKIVFELRCADADYAYKFLVIAETVYPPSFFMRHSPEEARKIIHEQMEECRRYLETVFDDE